MEFTCCHTTEMVFFYCSKEGHFPPSNVQAVSNCLFLENRQSCSSNESKIVSHIAKAPFGRKQLFSASLSLVKKEISVGTVECIPSIIVVYFFYCFSFGIVLPMGYWYRIQNGLSLSDSR